MLTKIFIVIVMCLILFGLLRGLFFLVREEATQRRTLHALTFRVIASLFLVIFLIAAYYFHWIVPHGVGG